MNPLDFDPREFVGYLARPLPDVLDRTVVNALASAGSIGADRPLASHSRAADSVLEAFAERAASLAVRTRDAGWIRSGVAALCATSTASDRREAEMVLCLLHDAAQRLGLSPGEVFSAGLSSKRDLIETFLRRNENDKSPSSMGYVAAADADGFRYLRAWSSFAMRDLKNDEQVLVGRWLDRQGRVEKDEVAARIDFLVGNRLERIAASGDGWDVLFIDRNDGRFWELSYPDSQAHGGGAPMLKAIDAAAVKKKYGLS